MCVVLNQRVCRVPRDRYLFRSHMYNMYHSLCWLITTFCVFVSLIKSLIRLAFEYITFQVHRRRNKNIVHINNERWKKKNLFCSDFVLNCFVRRIWTLLKGAIQTVNHTHTKISIGVGAFFVFSIFVVPSFRLCFSYVSPSIHIFVFGQVRTEYTASCSPIPMYAYTLFSLNICLYFSCFLLLRIACIVHTIWMNGFDWRNWKKMRFINLYDLCRRFENFNGTVKKYKINLCAQQQQQYQ